MSLEPKWLRSVGFVGVVGVDTLVHGVYVHTVTRASHSD